MKAYLTKRYWFSAAHRLHNPELPEEENCRLFGKCNHPYGHGHNYVLEVTVGGEIDRRTGMVCDLAVLDEAVQGGVMEPFDHQNLNCLSAFRNSVPTTEVLAKVIFERLRQSTLGAALEKIRVEETPQNFFEYAGGSEIRY